MSERSTKAGAREDFLSSLPETEIMQLFQAKGSLVVVTHREIVSSLLADNSEVDVHKSLERVREMVGVLDSELLKLENPEDEANPGYVLEPPKQKQSVLLDGENLVGESIKVETSKIERRVLHKMAKGRLVGLSELKELVEAGEGKEDREKVYNTMHNLEEKLAKTGAGNGFTVIIDATYGTWFRLPNVELTAVYGPAEAKRLDALINSFSAGGYEETISLLGSTKSGRPYNRGQALRAIMSTYSNLIKRSNLGILTAEEEAALEMIWDELGEDRFQSGQAKKIVKRHLGLREK